MARLQFCFIVTYVESFLQQTLYRCRQESNPAHVSLQDPHVDQAVHPFVGDQIFESLLSIGKYLWYGLEIKNVDKATHIDECILMPQ